jgi:hypothetical protein
MKESAAEQKHFLCGRYRVPTSGWRASDGVQSLFNWIMGLARPAVTLDPRSSVTSSTTGVLSNAGFWLRSLVAGLAPRRPRFAPGSIHVGFVVDKVALGQVFLRVLRFSPVGIIPPPLSKLISSGECVGIHAWVWPTPPSGENVGFYVETELLLWRHIWCLITGA